VLLSIAVTVWLGEHIIPLLQGFSEILMLFFLAWLTAFILDPVVSFLKALHVPRSLAVVTVFLALLLGLSLLGILIAPALLNQVVQLSQVLPGLVSQLPSQADLAAFLGRFGVSPADLSSIYRPDVLAQQLQSSAGPVLQGVLSFATSALTVVVDLLLLLIISFYMLLDGRRMVWDILRVMPRENRAQALIFLSQVSASFGGFLRGQVVQAILFGLLIAVLMLALGLDFVAVSTLTSATLMMIPIVGPILAVLPPLLIAAGQSQTLVLIVLVILVPVQFVLVNVLMPRVMSGQIGMPPLLVFLAILLGLRIGGPLGAFFGIPIMGVIYGTATVVFARYKNGDSRTLEPDDAE
jgi:predicted PurR-regulated permease PerM